MHAHQQPDRFTHTEPGADYLADLDAAERDTLADRVRRAGAVAWAYRHGRHVADADEQPGADDVPVADDGEHGDIDALRAAYDDACDRGGRPGIRDTSRRLAVHPDVHRRPR